MAYRVEFADRAVRDLEALYVEKNAAEDLAASRWYSGLEKAVCALEAFPLRCPAAPEARRMRRKLWHLLYGKKPHIYRVIYEVDERQKIVWVLHIRHGARRKLKTSDLATQKS
jgi:toxin ParE1/3/4